MKVFLSLRHHLLIITSLFAMPVFSQTVFPLYGNNIPNSILTRDEEESTVTDDSILIVSKVSRPSLTAYFPAKQKANGTAIIICPGGGYHVLAAGHEGADVAKRFNEMGITAFVLKYRIPDDKTMANKEIGPLQDAQRAIQIVRESAAKWKIDTHKIGIMGFSAGGHLASTAGTHFDKPFIANPKNTSLRPDFMILGYPVISFTDSIGHIGSRDQLIGKKPSKEKVEEYSNELQINATTPPAFLMHAKDDDVVKVENTFQFEGKLKKNNVAVEVYLYEKGGHGFGMINKTSDVRWMDILEKWLKRMKLK